MVFGLSWGTVEAAIHRLEGEEQLLWSMGGTGSFMKDCTLASAYGQAGLTKSMRMNKRRLRLLEVPLRAREQLCNQGAKADRYRLLCPPS